MRNLFTEFLTAEGEKQNEPLIETVADHKDLRITQLEEQINFLVQVFAKRDAAHQMAIAEYQQMILTLNSSVSFLKGAIGGTTEVQ